MSQTSPEIETLRKALEKAREEIVLAVAFLGRDVFTDRLNDTADSLVTRLAKADADARAALTFDFAQRPAVITDEMVQLACKIYSEVYIDDDKDQGDAMRAALAVAMSSTGGNSK